MNYMNSFIPQMSPMKWSYFLLINFIILFSFMMIMNSIPLNLNFIKSKNLSIKKWKYIW